MSGSGPSRSGRRLLLGGAGLFLSLAGLALAPATASARSTVPHPKRRPWPITLVVRTVPPLAGVAFGLDGAVATTSPAGRVSFTEQHNLLPHVLRLLTPGLERGERRYRFVAFGEARNPSVAYSREIAPLYMRTDQVLTAGFAASCLVSPRFLGDGRPIATGRIESLTLRSDSGSLATLRPAGASWLACLLPVFRGPAVSTRELGYSVQSLMVGETNIVHAGVERFSPVHTPAPRITGYFFTLRVNAHDALFRSGLGGRVLVRLPDGRVVERTFTASRPAVLRELPIGTYRVRVVSGGSVVASQSVSLSRNETLDAQKITTIDLVTLSGVVLALAIGLPLLAAERRRKLMRAVRSMGARRVSAPDTPKSSVA